MGKIKHAIPFKTVEFWLLCYSDWKAELAVLKEKLDHVSSITSNVDLVPIYSKGQAGNPVFEEVIQRLKMKEREIPLLEMRIRLIDKALIALTDEERQFIESRYFRKSTTFTAMNHMQWTHRMYYRNRKQILSKLYKLLGSEDAMIWFPKP